MSVVIRNYQNDDLKAFADIHYYAVHKGSKNFYPKEILNEWSPKVTSKRLENIKESETTEIRIIAEIEGKPVGLGCIVPKYNELRACYVKTNYSKLGIGRRIVNELETIAKSHHLKYLELDASINAKEFYQKCGYQIIEKSFHELKSGLKMECYKMRKEFKTS